jgi:hypothetical protein
VGGGTNVIWGLAILTALLFFASIVAHELSHAAIAKACGLDGRRPSWRQAACCFRMALAFGVRRVEVQSVDMASMSLLEPCRLISDEGFAGALRFAWNLLHDSEARRRVFEMRSVFRRYRKELAAVALVAIKS